jgi:hypothetical protein
MCKTQGFPYRTLGALAVGQNAVHVAIGVSNCITRRDRDPLAKGSRAHMDTIVNIPARMDAVLGYEFFSVAIFVLFKNDVQG